MNTEQIKELIVGPIAAVPTAFDASFRIDHGLMAAATERWIDQGLVRGRSLIKVGASIGEGHFLRVDESVPLLRTVVEAARGRVPVVGAIHHKDTLHTIEEARQAADEGVIALQISPPIFNLPSQDDLVRYYGAVSDAVSIGIIIYCTPWFQYGAVHPETLARMTDFEYVVAVKWSPPDGVDYAAVFDMTQRFTILDNNNRPVQCHKLGGRGYLIDGVEAYPPFFLGLWDIIKQGQFEKAQKEWERFTTPFQKYFAKVVGRSGSDAKIAKGMSKVMGLDLGPTRPPSVPLNAEELEELSTLLADCGWPVASS